MKHTLKFSYPRRGLSGQFATFRLGARVAQTHNPGDEVELVDSRSAKLLGRATVTEVYVGRLTDMAKLHSHMAHNWKDHPAAERPGLLVASMTKRYPPGRCTDDSLVSVLYLQEQPCTPPSSKNSLSSPSSPSSSPPSSNERDPRQ